MRRFKTAPCLHGRWLAGFCALAALLVLPAAPARSQCSQWIAGPLQSTSTGADGAVHCTVLWDPDGVGPLQELLVVGGDFLQIGGIPANRIASWDGAVWRPLGSGMDADVRALAVYNGLLIAGGDFLTAGGGPTTWVSRWNGYNWLSMSDGLFSGTGVYTLALHGGQLFAGGDFYRYTKRFDASSSTWVGFAQSLDGPVYALASYNGYLHAGGAFQNGGFDSRPHAARWDGFVWNNMDGGLPGNVHAMIVYNGLLYLGGSFAWDGQNGYQRNCIEWDGANWDYMDSGAGSELPGPVYALTSFNGFLYAGGEFTNSLNYRPRRVARWDFGGWDNLATGIGLGTFNGEAVEALAVYGGELMALGHFSTPTANIAHWNGSAWLNLTSPVVVNALATFGSKMALAGSFSQYFPSGHSYHVAAWNGQQLQPLTTGTNAPVRALVGYTEPAPPLRNRLVVAGDFTVAGGIAANRVALYTESDNVFSSGWSTMGDGFDGTVHALTRFYGATVAGGAFNLSGPNLRKFVARWDGTSWQAMGTGMNGPVFALKAYTASATTFRLVAGGQFTTANGTTVNGIAVWIASTAVPETPWTPLGAGFTGTVYAVEYHGSQVYAGGVISASGATPLQNVARYVVGTGWVSLGSGLAGAVYALKSSGGYLYAAGSFPGRVARWNGTSWSVVDGNADGNGLALAAWQGEVFAGGEFTTMRSGALASRGAARYSDTGIPWLTSQPFTQSVNQGENVSLTVQAAAGYTGVTYGWRRNGVPLISGPSGNGSTIWGATYATLTLEQIALADSGSYDCVVSNPCGSMTSGAAILTVTGPSGVGETGPAALTALSIGPNPFRSSTRISFARATSGPVRAEVFDLSGRRVRSLHDGELSSQGPFLDWDGRDDSGQALPAGSYFVRVVAGEARLSRRIILLK